MPLRRSAELSGSTDALWDLLFLEAVRMQFVKRVSGLAAVSGARDLIVAVLKFFENPQVLVWLGL